MSPAPAARVGVGGSAVPCSVPVGADGHGCEERGLGALCCPPAPLAVWHGSRSGVSLPDPWFGLK